MIGLGIVLIIIGTISYWKSFQMAGPLGWVMLFISIIVFLISSSMLQIGIESLITK